MIVTGDKRHAALKLFSGQIAFKQRRNQTLDQQAGGCRIAVMHFIAHVQRLRHQRFQFHLTEF